MRTAAPAADPGRVRAAIWGGVGATLLTAAVGTLAVYGALANLPADKLAMRTTITLWAFPGLLIGCAMLAAPTTALLAVIAGRQPFRALASWLAAGAVASTPVALVATLWSGNLSPMGPTFGALWIGLFAGLFAWTAQRRAARRA